jgi:VWFA-related protein
LKPGEVNVERQTNAMVVRTKPVDGGRVDVVVTVPFGMIFRAATRTHSIRIEGMVARALVNTDSGDIAIAAPWAATRLTVQATDEPPSLVLPERFKFSRDRGSGKDERSWILRDRLDDLRVTFGRIDVRAGSIQNLHLIDIPIPADSPIKMHWQAPQILDDLLAPVKSKENGESSKTVEARQAATEEEGIAVFRSDVRLVALNVSVTDKDGAPLTDLKPEEFEVLEGDVPQEIRHAGSEDVPFNLALLLDLSGSTRNTRNAMQEAARGFMNIARPQDRLALYALANDWFTVVSRLTKDRVRLESVLKVIPNVSGSSPVYDTIVLAYAEEFQQRQNERNALIILTDGADNQIYGVGVPSEVSFKRLKQAAEGMQALIYPVVLDPFTHTSPPRWARKAREQMEELARASGGRAFHSTSITDLSPIFPQVASELRSVYSLTYSPKNQDFHGEWRRITVRVKRPGARIRTRAGYFARP